MEEILRFLKEHRDVALATTDEFGHPTLRVFQVMEITDTVLYFCTSYKKEVYEQIRQSPYIAILSYSGDVSIRISGIADFGVDDDFCRKIYEKNPTLKRLYSNYWEIAYFRLPISRATYFDLGQNPPVHKDYTYTPEHAPFVSVKD